MAEISSKCVDDVMTSCKLACVVNRAAVAHDGHDHHHFQTWWGRCCW